MALRGIRCAIALVAALVFLIGSREASAQSSDDLGALNHQMSELYDQGKYAEALPLAERYVALARQRHGEAHARVRHGHCLAGRVYRVPRAATPRPSRSTSARWPSARRRWAPTTPMSAPRSTTWPCCIEPRAATPRPSRSTSAALAIREKALGPDHPDVGTSLNNLAELYQAPGPLRRGRAALQAQRSPSARRRWAPTTPTSAPRSTTWPGCIATRAATPRPSRSTSAALAIREKALGPDHPDVGTSAQQPGRAVPRPGPLRRGRAALQARAGHREKALGPDHPDVGTCAQQPGRAVPRPGPLRRGRAALQAQRSPSARRRWAPTTPMSAPALNNLAELYRTQGRYAEAEPLYKRASPSPRRRWAPTTPMSAPALNNLAALYFAQRDWARAADYWRRSTGVIVRRAAARHGRRRPSRDGKEKGEAEQRSYHFWGLVKAVHRLASDGRGCDASLASEMFQTAQWAQGSEAAASLAQMAARGAKGDPALAALVRERQDLVEEWQRRDAVRSAAVAQAPDKRDRAAEAANVARLAAIDARIADIDKRLVGGVPRLCGAGAARRHCRSRRCRPSWRRRGAGAVPRHAGVEADARGDLHLGRHQDGRALGALRPRHAGADARGGGAALRARCGAWDDEGSGGQAAAICCKPTCSAMRWQRHDRHLPFDLARAHALYKALFGQVEDLIRGKHLLIVPSGPADQLPFQVLVTKPTPRRQATIRSAAWLARKQRHHRAARRLLAEGAAPRAKAKRRHQAMLGFGNPLLDGDPASGRWEAEWAKLAREKQACPQTLLAACGGAVERAAASLPMATRGGRADLDHLRSQIAPARHRR